MQPDNLVSTSEGLDLPSHYVAKKTITAIWHDFYMKYQDWKSEKWMYPYVSFPMLQHILIPNCLLNPTICLFLKSQSPISSLILAIQDVFGLFPFWHILYKSVVIHPLNRFQYNLLLTSLPLFYLIFFSLLDTFLWNVGRNLFLLLIIFIY